MKCPICKTECGEKNICSRCGFNEVGVIFLNSADAEVWIKEKVNPHRVWWSNKQAEKTFLVECPYYDLIADIRDYLNTTPNDIRAKYEYISLLYYTIFQPQYHMKDGEVEYLVNLCIELMNDTELPHNTFAEQYRIVRINHAKATLLMLQGRLCDAYELFCQVAKDIDDISRESKYAFKDAADLLFRAEISIHQITELAGIDDSCFFQIQNEEISYFERYVDEINFTYQGSLCFPSLLPQLDSKKNPFFDVLSSNGNFTMSFAYGGMYFAMFQGRLSYSGSLRFTYWPINLYSGITHSQYENWTWTIEIDGVNRRQIQTYIESHPYVKEKGYIATLIARANARRR